MHVNKALLPATFVLVGALKQACVDVALEKWTNRFGGGAPGTV